LTISSHITPPLENFFRLVSDCLNARAEHSKLEDEYQRLRRLRQSSRHADLSEPARSALEVQLADCEVNREQKKSEAASAFALLAESDLWPVLSPQQPEARAALARYHALVETVGQLQATMTKLDQSIKSHIIEKHQGGTSGDPEDISTRPTKRRKTLETDLSGISSSGDTAEEIEDLEDRVVSLEGQLSNLVNSMTQRQNDLLDEIQAMLETKFDEMDFQPRQGELSGNVEKLAELEREITTVGVLVEEFAKDIENFKRRSSSQEVELTRLKERVQHLEALDTEVTCCILIYHKFLFDAFYLAARKATCFLH
jgi:chromosome segregation ATPase